MARSSIGFLVVVVLAIAFAVACGDSDNRGGSGGHALFSHHTDGNSRFFAVFFEIPRASIERLLYPGCRVAREVGSCRALTCEGALIMSADAGTITASVDGTEVLTAIFVGFNYTGSVGGTVFTPGQSVTIAASGAAVPSFSATVTAPEMASPSIPATIARGADVTVTWPSTLAAEEVQLVIVPMSSFATFVECRVSAAASSLELDGGLTSMLPPGNVEVSFSAFNTSDVTAGTRSIAVQAAEETSVSATVM